MSDDAQAASASPDLYAYIPDIVKNAMLTMWNYICTDSKCHPLDIEHGRGKILTFQPAHWAQFTGEMVQQNIHDLFVGTPPQAAPAAEEFAKLAEGHVGSWLNGGRSLSFASGYDEACRDIAKAIRDAAPAAPQAAPEMTPADAMVTQIEERFPNWKSYRDLVDCIDCTLHDLRRGAAE